MSKSRGYFDKFQPHSKHKHLILEHYFLAWGHKLGLGAGARDTILYVDACAGRGKDELGSDGSPLIAARAAAVAQSNVSARRRSPFRIQVVAVESNRAHFASLSSLLAPFKEGVRTILGSLDGKIDALEVEFADTPTLYFIDPFGMKPLQGALVRRALAGPHHEVLLLFADQAALRHFGAIVAIETRAERVHRRAASRRAQQPELFPDIDDAEGERVEALAEVAHDSRTSQAEARTTAIQILNAAFESNTWQPAIEATAKNERRTAFLRLYAERLNTWGATHVLQIPVVAANGVRAYTLIHASKSPKAFVAMKEAVSHALENSPLDAEVVERMRRLVQGNANAIASAVVGRFAGQRVRLTEDPHARRAACVRNFVLEETDGFPFQMAEVKDLLNEYRQPGRTFVYAFPEPPIDVD